MLGVLREDGAPAAARPPALVDGSRRWSASTPTPARRQPRGHGRRPAAARRRRPAAYRIVQEALTNVLKHAGPAAVPVTSAPPRRPRGQVPTTAAARRPRHRHGSGGPRPARHARAGASTAASSSPGPAPAAAAGARPPSPAEGPALDDPGPGRRRPGPGAGRLPDAHRLRARPRRGRRGRGRPGGRRPRHRARPDVVLMDIRMPELDGIEATRRIVADDADADPGCSILTTFDLDEYVFAALRAGASGFLLKDTRRRGPPRRRARRRRRRGAAVAARSPAGSSTSSPPAPARPPPGAADRSTRSPSASARCWPRSAGASPTPRSPRRCSSGRGDGQDPRRPRADQAARSATGPRLVVIAYESGLVTPGGN